VPALGICGEDHTQPKQRDIVTPTAANFKRALVEAPGQPSIPLDWVRGVELLRRLGRPSGVPQHRWLLFLEDCERFLDLSNGWAERAAKLGWDTRRTLWLRPKSATGPTRCWPSVASCWWETHCNLQDLGRDRDQRSTVHRP